MLRRCEHDVYLPADIEGEQNPFCSGCSVMNKGINPPRKIEEDSSDEISIFNACPICSSKEFSYQDENDYNCPVCGFCERDII